MFVVVVVPDGHGVSGGEFVGGQAAAVFACSGEDLVLVFVERGKLSNKVLYGPQFLATIFSTQFQKLKLSVSIFMAKSRYTNT